MEIRSISGADLARMLGGASEQRSASRPLPEAQVATLLEVYQRYAAGCPFQPGDLVTPRQSYAIKEAGEPHIVLEVRKPGEDIRQFDCLDVGDIGSSHFGARQDVRVACICEHGQMSAFWMESWRLEPFSLEVKGSS